MSTRAIVYFAIVGALAALSLAFPDLILLGLILLIVPGVLLAIAPSLLIYSLIAYVVWISVDMWRWPIRLAAVMALWGSFALLPPLYYNAPTERQSAEMRAGDIAFSGPPLRGATIAIVTPDLRLNLSKDQSACDALCLRLLYNGAAQRVIREDRPLTPASTGLRSFRIERRDACPAPGQLDDTSLPGEPAVFWDRPADRFRLRIASGECLIAEPADGSQIDILLLEHTLKPTGETGFSRPWDLKLDTLSARRIEVMQRDGADMRARLRKTEVTSEPLLIPFAIGPVSGRSLDMTSGFVRRPVTENRFNFYDVAVTVFGDGAKMPDRPLDANVERQLLIAALRNPALPANDARLQLADQVLKLISHHGPIGPDDVVAVRLMIEDPRITSFFHLAAAVAKLGPDAVSLAGPLLDRLLSAPWPQGRDTVQTTSRAIYRLPPGALLPVMDKLEALSQMPVRRGAAYLALSRLRDEGSAALPKLLALMEAPQLHKDDAFNDERSAELGALMGLCRLGPDNTAAQEKLAGIIRNSPPYNDRRRLAVEALVLAGKKDVALAAAEGNPDRLKNVEREIQRAENPRNSRVCEY